MSLLRTAAHMGVASSVHGRVQRRQRGRWAAQDQAMAAAAPPLAAPAPAPAPPAPAAGTPSMDDKLDQLKKLGELRDAGILTDAEFDAKKTAILGT